MTTPHTRQTISNSCRRRHLHIITPPCSHARIVSAAMALNTTTLEVSVWTHTHTLEAKCVIAKRTVRHETAARPPATPSSGVPLMLCVPVDPCIRKRKASLLNGNVYRTAVSSPIKFMKALERHDSSCARTSNWARHSRRSANWASEPRSLANKRPRNNAASCSATSTS